MVFKNFEGKLIARVILLLLTLSLPSLVIIKGWPVTLVFILPILAYQVYDLIGFLREAQEELMQFIESVHYRDFTRHFNEQHTYKELSAIRKGFNEINTTFKTISREKETQYQNLQKIIELVDTGIMSYQTDSGEVLLMNESLKKLLHLPYLKNLQTLAKRDSDLYKAVHDLPPGHTVIAAAHTDHPDKRTIKILLSATSFQNEGNNYKLVAFQNINEALDETESLAWQKLLNVMTHEIMNSIAPISSLASTLKSRLKEIAIKGPFPEDMEDLEVGISSIQKRSEGLLRFAETYRNLNKITTLNLNTVSVNDLFVNLQHLMEPTLAQKNIRLSVIIKNQHLALQADSNLLDQVLINLLLNAIEALKERPDPEITLSAFKDAGRQVVIRMADNGKGMSKEVQEKIFIPFFSTRKNGSGIGLSLCKQIVLLHRGTIQVQSIEGEGTAFTLRFAAAG